MYGPKGWVFGPLDARLASPTQRLCAGSKGLPNKVPHGHLLRLMGLMSRSKGMKCTLVSARTFPPEASEGWTIHFIERNSRYWVAAQAGKKQAQLFEHGTQSAWDWAKSAQFIRWFTDGERRYGKALWKLASVYLKSGEAHSDYHRRKVWREGLEVAMKIKGSQGKRRVEWVYPEHPFTAISAASEVHANHNEAQNSALRRRCSAYRRRQNLYAKHVQGLQRVLDVQRLIHNWVRPHWGLAKGITPAMAIGLCDRPVSIHELLTSRRFDAILH
jgi:hypothetical protein